MSAPGFPGHTRSLLVGRDRELSVLRDHLAAAIAGHGSLVLIGGEAGIGKTALAEMLCRKAAEQTVLVLTGRCFDRAETPAYGPWLYLFERYLDPRRPTPGSLPPPPAFITPGTVGAVASQVLLFRQVLDFFKGLAAQQPVILLLDDAQWSDPASLDLLRFLAQSLDTVSLLILVTYRSDELGDHPAFAALLPALVREAHAARLDLHPLDDAAVRALVTARYRLPDTDGARLVTYLQARAEGNPLFLGELLRTLEEEGALKHGDAIWSMSELASTAVPPLLRQVIDRRCERLDGESQRLLTVAAVIGQEVPMALWATVTEVDEDALADVVEHGLRAGVLRESPSGEGVQFTHALMREAVFARLPAVRRRPIHRRVGEALVHAHTPDPDAVAYHFRHAGDDRAPRWLIIAGERAYAILAWATARARFEAALALLGEDEERVRERAILHFRLSVASQFESAERGLAHIEEAARLAQRSDDLDLTARIQFFHGTALCRLNDFTAGVPLMRAGLAALEALSSAERASGGGLYELDAPVHRLTTMVLQWLALAGYLAEVEALNERHRTDASTAVADGIAWGALAMVHLYRGQPDAAQRALEQSRVMSERMGHYYIVTSIWERLLCDVVLQYRADHLAEREQVTRHLEQAIVREREFIGSTYPPRVAWLPLLALAGPWDEVPELSNAAIAGLSHFGCYFTGIVACAQGDRATLQALLDTWLPAGLDTPPGSVRWRPATYMQCFAAAQALNRGDLPTARQWLEMHDRWLAWNGATLGRAEGEVLWAAYHRAMGDLAAAGEHARQALALASEPKQPLALLASLRLLGELATDAGAYDDAIAHLDAALALADACAASHERALTVLARAAVHIAMHEHAAANARIEEVRVICAPLGAWPALARADALAAQQPARRVYPDGLTGREIEVLRLIAAGSTNQEIAATLFLSIRTVERHITTIYRRIDARGRADATAYAARHDLLPLNASPT